MRRLTLALLPLLLWIGVACSSGSGNTSQTPAHTTATALVSTQPSATPAACPTPTTAAAVATATPSAPDESYLGTSVQSAVKLLQKFYLQPIPSTGPLFEAAYTGARDKAKLTDPLPADFAADPAARFIALSQQTEGKASYQELTDAALSAMAATFKDKHTVFLSSTSYRSESKGGTSSYGFISMRYGEGALVSVVYPGTIAEAAGLKRGDVVTSVDGKPAGQLTSADFTRLNDGRPFPIIYTRRGGPAITFQDQIKPISLVQTSVELLPGSVGYLRLYSFPRYQVCNSEGSFQDLVDKAVSDLKAKGARSWILDLRANGGGAIQGAGYLAGLFGFEGRLATLRYNDNSVNKIDANGQKAIGDAPFVVLIDEQSQSASEIMAFALEDGMKVPLIGAHTAGNVQAAGIFPVGGGAMQITYATVGIGAFEQHVDSSGVQPTIPVTLDRDLLAKEGRDTQIEAAVAYLKSHVR